MALIPIFVTLASVVYLLAKGFNDRRNASLTAELSNLKATRDEGDKQRALAAQAIIDAPPTIVTLAAVSPDAFKVLYIGSTSDDQVVVTDLFRDAGIENQVVTLDSAQAGFAYLQAHPTILFCIILVDDIKKGLDFLRMVQEDDTTNRIPVIFTDGPAGELASYKAGGAGYIPHPINFSDLLRLLNSQRFKTTITKDN